MNTLFRTMLVTALLAVGSQAQFAPGNARTGGLGGTFIMDDMTDMLRYPAYINKYENAIQVTFNSPIIGVKSIGDVMSLGVVANRGFMLDNDTLPFYALGATQLANQITAIPQALRTQIVPHILIGAELSSVSLGFDIYFEHASSSLKSETDAATAEAKSSIKNPGLVASALFGTEELSFAAKYGISFPSIYGSLDNGTTELEVTSDKGLAMDAGVEVTLPVSDFDVTAGVNLMWESFAFAVDTADPATIYGKHKFAFFAGLEGDLFTTARWGAMATVFNRGQKTTNPADTAKEGNYQIALNCGIENTWSSVWVFDECFARGGMMFSTVTPGRYSKNATTETTTHFQTTYEEFSPTVGAGVKKGAFQLDVTINPASWAGVLTGPAVGLVTGTFSF